MNLLAQNIGNHLTNIKTLTPKGANHELVSQAITDNQGYGFLFSPLLIYGLVILFLFLFLGAIVVQIIYRVFDWKKTGMSLVAALLIASSPLLVRTVLQTTSIESQASPDEMPKNVSINQEGQNVIVITWETQVPKIGMIRFGTAPLTEGYGKTAISNNGQKTTQHQIILEKLQRGIDYEFDILSGSTWYSNDGQSLRFKVN